MDKKIIWLLGGAAVVLVGIITASLLYGTGRSRSRKDVNDNTEKRERREDTESDSRKHDKKDRQGRSRKKIIRIDSPGYLYYLAPGAESAFAERLTDFLADRKLKASSVNVMADHVDDRDREDEPAVFYLQLDDDEGTLVAVSFEKTSGDYTFSVCDDHTVAGIRGRTDNSEGKTEHTIPESTEDEDVTEEPVTITDPEKELTGAADMERLKEELTAYLYSVDEGRRNLYVSSFGLTEKGYEAVLDFETVRHDGRNVEVKYDGSYHFQLV